MFPHLRMLQSALLRKQAKPNIHFKVNLFRYTMSLILSSCFRLFKNYLNVNHISGREHLLELIRCWRLTAFLGSWRNAQSVPKKVAGAVLS